MTYMISSIHWQCRSNNVSVHNFINFRYHRLRPHFHISGAVEFNKKTLISSKILTVEIKSFLNCLCALCEAFAIHGHQTKSWWIFFLSSCNSSDCITNVTEKRLEIVTEMRPIIQLGGIKIILRFLFYGSQFRFWIINNFTLSWLRFYNEI